MCAYYLLQIWSLSCQLYMTSKYISQPPLILFHHAIIRMHWNVLPKYQDKLAAEAAGNDFMSGKNIENRVLCEPLDQI